MVKAASAVESGLSICGNSPIKVDVLVPCERFADQNKHIAGWSCDYIIKFLGHNLSLYAAITINKMLN